MTPIHVFGPWTPVTIEGTSIACPQAEGASTMNTADTMTIVKALRADVICFLLSTSLLEYETE